MKILCLGVGGCGKTTFIKQMKIIHGIPWNPVELDNFVKVVRGNFITGIQDCVEAAKRLGLNIEAEDAAKEVMTLRARTADLTSDQVELLKTVHGDPAVQEVLQNHTEMISTTHFSYFWENLDRIVAPNYVPNDDDILRARMRTAGSNSSAIYIDKNYFEFYDVGGQKPERSKWESVLTENKFAAVIYFVACDEWDVKDDEKDFDKTKLEISRFIFNEIVNSNVVAEDVPIILFLNREDLLDQRLKSPEGFESFKETFPDYTGGNAKAQALEHMKNFFLSVAKGKRMTTPIKFHYTCALDRDGMVVIWKIIRDFLIDLALKDMGLK